MTKRTSLPGVLFSGRKQRRQGPRLHAMAGLVSPSAVAYFQPRFYKYSIPYQVEPIPEGGASSNTPEDPGTVLGVPPSAPTAEIPTYNQLSVFLTHPESLVYVGTPLDPSIVPTGTATAPYAEIADAMTWIAGQAGTIFEVDVAPGSYADFTVPAGKTVTVRGSSFTVPAITIDPVGVLVFSDVQNFQGTAPAITFSAPASTNAVYFDSPSARAFGMAGGTLVNGKPICQGPGPYLAFPTGSVLAAFDSVVEAASFSVELANMTTDVQTVGVVYPAVPALGTGVVALVWPSGTVVPDKTGLAAGPIFKASNGTATVVPTTQLIGVDDGARFYVGIQDLGLGSLLQAPGTVFGVPPQAPVDEYPSFNRLSVYLTHPKILVYVGALEDTTITPTGTAVAPFAEIADAMSYIAATSDVVFEVVAAPGTYENFAVPAGKAVYVNCPLLNVAAITIASGGSLFFVGVTNFPSATAITFSVPATSNSVFFDPVSSRSFGFGGGMISNGAPICDGAGPYLAFADADLAAFDSAVTSAKYHVTIANGTPDTETVGIIYPAVSSGALALVWPSGTIIPATTGLAAGVLYRASTGHVTETTTTQQVGNDDSARVFVNLQQVPTVPSASGTEIRLQAGSIDIVGGTTTNTAIVGATSLQQMNGLHPSKFNVSVLVGKGFTPSAITFVFADSSPPNPGDEMEVFLLTSTDGGVTWSVATSFIIALDGSPSSTSPYTTPIPAGSNWLLGLNVSGSVVFQGTVTAAVS